MSARSWIGRAVATLVFVSTMGASDRVRVERETLRLARLQQDLREVSEGRDRRTPEQHMEEVSREIDEIEKRLRAPFGNPYPATHEEYHRGYLTARAREQAETMRMLRKTESDLLDPRLDRDHAANLNAWKVKLEADLAMPLPDPERDLAGSEEQMRLRAERESFERRVADLRASLRYWSQQRSGGGTASRDTRRRVLRLQIEEQRALVGTLRPQEARD